MLDGTFHRTGAEFRVIPCIGKEVYGSICQNKFYTVTGKHLLHTLDLEHHNLLDFGLCQWQEHDGLVDTVQEFRADGLFQHIHHFLFGFLYDLLLIATVELLHLALDIAAAHVGGHDDNRILEVDRTSFIVCQTSVIQHLQQDVEYVRMCFLDFVEQDDRIRFPPYGFCQLSAFIVAHISRRRSYQTGNAVFLLILAHVDTGHHRLVVKEELRQCLCQFRLTYTGGSQEKE